jgi:hypothetical protein
VISLGDDAVNDMPLGLGAPSKLTTSGVPNPGLIAPQHLDRLKSHLGGLDLLPGMTATSSGHNLFCMPMEGPSQYIPLPQEQGVSDVNWDRLYLDMMWYNASFMPGSSGNMPG